MRRALHILTIALFATCCLSYAAGAQTASAPVRGSVPGDTQSLQLPSPTEAELAEAQGIFNSCGGNNAGSFYDCNCVAVNFLQLRVTERAIGRPRSNGYTMRQDASRNCVNTEEIAGDTFRTCSSWAARIYPDPQGFCSCYANRYAVTFAKSPTDSLTANQSLMTNALTHCNAGEPALLSIERARKVREMKRLGIYDEMFPSAKASGLTTTLPEIKRAPANAPLSQRLSEKLLLPDTEPRRPDR